MQIVKFFSPGCSILYTERADSDMKNDQDVVATCMQVPSLQSKKIMIPKLLHGSRCTEVVSSSQQDGLACDAVFTHISQIALGIRVADCLPIVFFDVKHRVLAMVHGGWRSLLQNIISLTVLKMQILHGTKPQDLSIWIGPSLRVCCNRMEHTDVHEKFREWIPFLVKKDGKTFLNLQSAVIAQCMDAGIQKKNIIDSGQCTFHEKDQFFSYRRQKQENPGVPHSHFAVIAWIEE